MKVDLEALEATAKEVQRLAREYGTLEIECLTAGEVDTMEIRKLRAEVTSMRAVVEAAEAWRNRGSGAGDTLRLVAAVDAYQKGKP